MASPSVPYPRRWQALAVLALSLLIVSLDNTIMNVALPTIREELDATASELQWIVDGYLLVFAGLLLTAGSLGDRFGRRRLLYTGLGIFGAGSLLATFSSGATELIASRCLMGVGGAAIMPTTLSILTNIFPANERPKAIAAWAGAAGLGVAVGPVVGGALIENFDWTSVFLVNLPVVAACAIGAAALVPESRDPSKPRLDLVGGGLSIGALTAIVWALIEAPERGWTSPGILAGFGIGTLVAVAFVMWERRSDHPMIDVRVFRNMRFTAANVSVTFVYFALMGVIFFLTTYLQSVMGYSALESGVRTLPVAVGLIVASRLSVTLVERFGTKIVVSVGLGTVAAALAVLSTAQVDSGYGLVALALGLLGTGMGMAMSPATEAIMGALPKEKAGVGSAMNDVVREVGGTLGVAVLGSILSAVYGSHMDGDAVKGLPHDAAEAASDSVGAAHSVADEVGGAVGAKITAVADSAFVEAMSTASLVAAAVACAGALVAALFLPARAAAKGRSASGSFEALPAAA